MYRQNSVSVRIRIVDPDFHGMSKADRNDLVWDYLDRLSDDCPSRCQRPPSAHTLRATKVLCKSRVRGSSTIHVIRLMRERCGTTSRFLWSHANRLGNSRSRPTRPQTRSDTMIIVPGQAGKDLCDPQLGVTRRDILRVGGSGLLGLGLGSMLELQAVVGPWRRRPAGGPGLGQGQEHHHGLSPGRAQPPRPLGPQGERPRQRPERLQADRHQGPRHPGHRDPAQAGADHRQVHVHPLDELHAQRPVQPHGRHLPDDDRLHDRQGQPVGPARAAQPQGLPQLRLADHPAPAADRADAAVRDAAAAAAGEQRRRQGRHGRLPGQGVTTPTRSTPTATTWT